MRCLGNQRSEKIKKEAVQTSICTASFGRLAFLSATEPSYRGRKRSPSFGIRPTADIQSTANLLRCSPKIACSPELAKAAPSTTWSGLMTYGKKTITE